MIEPGETRVMADIQGPGQITHIWMTQGGHYRECLLRMECTFQYNADSALFTVHEISGITCRSTEPAPLYRKTDESLPYGERASIYEAAFESITEWYYQLDGDKLQYLSGKWSLPLIAGNVLTGQRLPVDLQGWVCLVRRGLQRIGRWLL